MDISSKPVKRQTQTGAFTSWSKLWTTGKEFRSMVIVCCSETSLQRSSGRWGNIWFSSGYQQSCFCHDIGFARATASKLQKGMVIQICRFPVSACVCLFDWVFTVNKHVQRFGLGMWWQRHTSSWYCFTCKVKWCRDFSPPTILLWT